MVVDVESCFVCLLACLFVCLFFCLFFCSFVRLFDCSFVCLLLLELVPAQAAARASDC